MSYRDQCKITPQFKHVAAITALQGETIGYEKRDSLCDVKILLSDVQEKSKINQTNWDQRMGTL